ncbi:MAG: 1-acyl-sn-glycerol-3-phosphate acyltransferase [Flavobacteriales bacterium]|jgi:1-acyl-sn-glycerol-3-phosphate acyltransferase|nr:1-acyl-sn-glycerol-3-phosphate acyltransferase [Flavobacteriales bacterium]
MKVKATSVLYSVLFPFVWLTAKLFYRKYNVEGLYNFPERGTPCIVVSNHQNGLMDPLMCCLSAPRQLHFLTRADVFKPGLAFRFVSALNMLPVYRMHDRVSDMAAKNDEVFDICVKRLKMGAVVALFPEGNHGNSKTLRPLKKGLARLVYKAIEQDPSMENIHIVPMGVHYDNYEDFRSKCIVRIGEAIPLKKWFADHPNTPANQSALMGEVKKGLQEVILDLQPKTAYPALHAYTRFMESQGASLDQVLSFEANWTRTGKPSLIEEFEQLAADFQNQSIDIETFNWSKKLGFVNYIALFFMFPLAILGYFIHALPALVSSQIVKGKIKDPHFTSTFKMSFGMILIPLFTSVIALVIGIIASWKWTLLFLLASIVLGIIAVLFYDQFSALRRRNTEKKLRTHHPELFRKWDDWQSKMRLIKG